MKFVLLGLLLACVALTAHAQIAAVQPGRAPTAPNPSDGDSAAKHHNVVSTPLLGFLQSPGENGLRQIVGTAAHAYLGEFLQAPASAAKIYLAPRQMYALVEQQLDEPLKLWEPWHPHTASDSLLFITGQVMRQPDLVGFSPRGGAAALYSSLTGKLQILDGLPRSAALKYELAASPVGPLTKAAVSDDGTVVVVEDTHAELYVAAGAGQWRMLAGVAARAWLFLPHSHDLLISDSARNSIVIARGVDAPSSLPVVVAGELQPDLLAVTKDGETAAALDSGKGRVWSIALLTGAVTSVTPDQVPNALMTLRSGHTFLLSTSPHLSLLEAPSSPEINTPQFSMEGKR